MDFSRLPSRRYADEDAGRRRQHNQERPQREERQQQQQHEGTQQAFVPPSSLLNQQQHTSASLPPLSQTMSANSGSTKYSPGIDGLDKELGGTRNSSAWAVPAIDDDESNRNPADSTAHLFRDTQGNVYHPSVTFAPQPSPRAGRPNTLGLPSLSFGGGGGNDASGNLHPGMGNRRGSSRAAEDGNAGGGYSGVDFKRKRSLVRPERERLNPDTRNFHYAQHSAAFQAENGGRVGVSGTGYGPTPAHADLPYGGGQGGIASYGLAPGLDGRPDLRRGKSILAREEGMAHESGLNFLKRGATLRRNKKGNNNSKEQYAGITNEEMLKGKNGKDASKKDEDKPPLTAWMIYCYIVTCFLPGAVLKSCGYRTLDRRRAFREKLGLLSVIASIMAAVGFLTFGFTDAVCGNQALRFHAGSIQAGSMIFHGYDYSMDRFEHPAASGVETNSNPLYSDWNAGGKDGSFLFQNVNANCKGLITRATGSPIPQDADGNLGWYFPCNFNDQFSSLEPNTTDYAGGRLCHTQPTARSQFAAARDRQVIGMQWEGPVYYTWDNITNSTRNLGVYKSSVLDFSLLRWLDREFVDYPPIFDDLARGNTSYEGRDSTMQLLIAGNRTLAECMDDIIRVGFVDSKTIGCVVADIVLYVSLVFILAVVGIKFAMAVIYSWFFGRRLGAFKSETKEERAKKIQEVENWTKDIYRPAPSSYRPNVKNARKSYLPTTSRFTAPVSRPYSTFDTGKRQSTFGSKNLLGAGLKGSPPDSPLRSSRSNASLPLSSMNINGDRHSRASSFDMLDGAGRPCPFPLDPNINMQPPPDWQPYGFPLAHTMLLVTAYSESVEGLRTTLDSLATSDYPNSHKFILVIADGLVRGSGNDATTPDIVLSMMKGLITPAEEVEAMSYVAVADGRKRHNMAKVFAGYYDYDNETVEMSKQQRVPMILIAKCGSPLEAHDGKPGNRGKRDSQVLLMAFLQKVMFDERMTNFEYEFFNAIWRVTGVSADNYEHVLMVDADTKVFPDAVTRMVACMVQDVDIMGLCGETKIANKSETWVTMIQVFEYYISHHQTKAFESMWGGVTCLPGCFSMYRIKAPKGGEGYYVPILANPDIVEHYSENVVDNLHKKNLLLLGEDRYLTTLMLKTFPKRKMMFCPQAYCKTVVPDTFRVLLSQRRRWINSTIHNLFELLLVRDLCGTFCFSMQFVVFMELVGTLVLPAAIAFTIYILVLTCIPNREKPIIPLILLACILGLPGLLIIVTSRKIAYVGWMAIYLLSLPIWNAVLPTYAYFHMDDFSWGSTRKIHGESKTSGHDDKEGEFDSQSIVMKRWSEWERERRWKNGTRSRDSTFEVIQRSGSPYRSSTTRNSVISTTDTFVSQGGQPQDPFFRGAATPSGYSSSSPAAGGARRQVDNVQVLELPAPLAVTHQPQAYQHIPSQTEIYDSPDSNVLHNYEASPYQSSSSENFHPNPSPPQRTEDEYPRYPAQEPYDSDSAEREAILSRRSIDPYEARKTSPELDSSLQVYPASDLASSTTRPSSMAASRISRGVSLYDPGPVSAPDGAVRIVQRNRRSSTVTKGRQSLGDGPSDQHPDDSPPAVPLPGQDFALPPGAAPRM